jgi:DoxX-like family
MAGRRLLDLHGALRAPDKLHRLRPATYPRRGQGLCPPRLPQLKNRTTDPLRTDPYFLAVPAYFRIELALAKLAGVAALLVPMVPAQLKEWAYAGFAINLVSALIAHLSIGDRPAALAPSATTSVLWALSYFFWRRLQTRLSEATDCS